MGGYAVQAEMAEAFMEVLADAKALEEAGASSISLVAVASGEPKLSRRASKYLCIAWRLGRTVVAKDY